MQQKRHTCILIMRVVRFPSKHLFYGPYCSRNGSAVNTVDIALVLKLKSPCPIQFDSHVNAHLYIT